MVVVATNGRPPMNSGSCIRTHRFIPPRASTSAGVLRRKIWLEGSAPRVICAIRQAMNAVSRSCVPVSGSKSPHFSEIMGLGNSGAQERTRTFTAVKPLAPEASASTNSATWARAGYYGPVARLSNSRKRVSNSLYSTNMMAYRETAKYPRDRSNLTRRK